ncbi:AarF/ABC1/UbiB kinase family protein, partial [bacterium]|nr:AarF/ABC1/UbiB kinase family protein [bacterium]
PPAHTRPQIVADLTPGSEAENNLPFYPVVMMEYGGVQKPFVLAGYSGQGEALSQDIILSILSHEWQCDPFEVLQSISDQPLCASLGQVHKAVLQDGRCVAIKVQYPNIRDSIETDLKLLGWISSPFNQQNVSFQLEDYQNEIAKNIENELDYIKEANHQRRFAKDAKNSHIPAFIVPEVVDDLCTQKVLVSIFEESTPLHDMHQMNEDERSDAQTILMNVFIYTVFHTGFFHADPHPGNIGFRKRNGKMEVVYYDFGSMGEITEDKKMALLKLVQGTIQKASFSPYSFYLTLGFDEKYLHAILLRLPALNEVFFAPFLAMGKFEFKHWNRTSLSNQILGDERWNFRLAAPANLIFMMKSFIGIFHFLQTLNPSFYFKPHIESLISSYQKELSQIKTTEVESFSYDDMASSLKISVFENSMQKVQLTFQRHLVNQLRDLIPPEVLESIDKKSIDLDAIIKNTHEKGYPVGDLFVLEENNKVIRVWLE